MGSICDCSVRSTIISLVVGDCIDYSRDHTDCDT